LRYSLEQAIIRKAKLYEMSLFVPGRLYKRREEIHEKYGGKQQGGISTPTNVPAVFIFTGEIGSKYGYSDRYDEDGCFLCTGEGHKGDMRMIRGNRAIRDHEKVDKTLCLFEEVDGKRGYRNYVGEFSYIEHFTEPRPDKDGNVRNAIVFRLAKKSTSSHDPPEGSTATRLEVLRQFAMQQDRPHASPTERIITLRERSQAVKAYSLERAQGKCEGCRTKAPFESPKGPYLEVHHVFQLSDDGPDEPWAVIALCPNCHRRAHYSIENEEFNSELKALLQQIESRR
jgi:5-methylcytosine-specific restriction protein A